MHFYRTILALGLAATAAAAVFAAAGVFMFAVAAPPATTAAAPDSASVALSRVRTLENRFFFHSYEQDPIEKRLQRLELLVFGQTKDGSNQERLQHLNTTIAERDRESALKMQRQHQAAAAATQGNSESGATANKTPGHYPAVTSLEWRVLKKTYPSEALDDRLGRLETKLFGQPSPTMSYADRVDRLNRTLGIGAVASAPPRGTSRYRGPMPKTHPGDNGNFTYEFRSAPFGSGEMNPAMPFFANPGFFGFSDPQVSELFKQMNEQMEEMMRMTVPPGQFFEENPTTPPKKLKPRWKVLPEHGGNSTHQSPAPYNDPNSI